MIAFDTVALLRPLWLAALPVIAAVSIYFGRRSGRLGSWEGVIERDLMAALRARGAVLGSTIGPNFPAIVAATMLVLALAGPAIERADANAFRNLDATVVVFDLSGSMADGDRLQRARFAARRITESVGSRQVGLIVFAGDAYVANPLTTDAEALDATLFALHEDSVPDPGNRPARAVSLARRLLQDSGVVSGDIALVSAGGAVDDQLVAEIRQARAVGYRVSTVWASAVHPSKQEISDSALLKMLATIGDGTAVTVDDMERLTSDLHGRLVERIGAGDFAPLVFAEMGKGLLVLAAASSLLLFRRNSP
jgi:Ca-activated chloride channel family protein